MMWKLGRDRIAALISNGELEVVLPDIRVAQQLLEDARRHLASSTTIQQSGDLTGAYQLAYDVFRKSAAALLAVQGLRSTSRGGHIAVQDAVLAQFDGTKAFNGFSRIRRTRNKFEYPDSATAGPSVDDVDDAIALAGAALEASTKLLASGALSPWSS